MSTTILQFPVRGRAYTSAYTLFCNDKRPEVAAANPEAKFYEVGRMLGAAWKARTDEENEKYQALAAEAQRAAASFSAVRETGSDDENVARPDRDLDREMQAFARAPPSSDGAGPPILFEMSGPQFGRPSYEKWPTSWTRDRDLDREMQAFAEARAHRADTMQAFAGTHHVDPAPGDAKTVKRLDAPAAAPLYFDQRVLEGHMLSSNPFYVLPPISEAKLRTHP
jgi:hypothetical protein